MTERIKRAIVFATEKHEGQFRKGGKPYITHPLAVAKWLEEAGYGEEYILAGLFHDLLEDTNATKGEILELGGAEVLRAVELVTKEKGYTMSAYTVRILENPMAKAVKIADRIHNLSCLLEADEKFKERYIKETEEWYLGFSEKIAEALEDAKK